MNYYYKKNMPAKWRRWQRAHHLFMAVACLLIVGGSGYGLYAWFQLEDEPIVPITNAVKKETVHIAALKLQENEHFRFKSGEAWSLSVSDSTPPTKYVYKDMNHVLVERILTVYLNTVPADTKVTYLAPVILKEDGSLVAGQISKKCGEGSGQRNPYTATYQGVQFTCIPDSPSMIIAAGFNGQGYGIPMNTSTGQTRRVGLLFQDVTISPDTTIFTEIINNFRLK